VSDRVKQMTQGGINFEGHTHELCECRRFYPHIAEGEGQFFCLMKRDEDSEAYVPKKKKKGKEKPEGALSKEEASAVEGFFEDNLTAGKHSFTRIGDTVMISDDLPACRAALTVGVAAGTVTKGRLEPHHHLFTAMGREFKRKVCLTSDSPDAQAYLSGEVIETKEKNGWCAVLIDGCPAGGGKIVDGKVKNHYPKGLRLVK